MALAHRQKVVLFVFAFLFMPTNAASDDAGMQQTRTAAAVTPLQKLVQMLDDMVAKGKKDKIAEQVEFAKFHEWCDGMRADKTKAIQEAAEQIDQLAADIDKAKSDAAVLSEEISALEAAIAKAEEELEAATTIRKKELADYEAEHQDLSESISACERAIATLQARSEDVPQSLAQVTSLKSLPAQAKAVIGSFLSVSLEEGAPEANAYEFQSGGVVDMLEKLAAKFKAKLLEVTKEEMTAKANYQLLKQQLTDDIKADGKAVSEKTAQKASRLEDAAQAKSELQATTKTKADDEQILSDTNAECLVRANEYEKNQVTRAEEVKAIEKATEILSSDAVSGNAQTYLPTLVQIRRASHARVFVQASIPASHESAMRRRLYEFLQARARSLGSRNLALAADRAASDPFAKVKQMIKDLIVKLMEQTNAEADEHSYCITELAKNKERRDNKQSEVEELAATVEKLTAESARLESEIAELSAAIAELQQRQKEATEIRVEEKATNAKTVADAKEAAVAVQKATQVLKDFYSKAADASFLQGAQESEAGDRLQEEMTAAVNAPYKGMQASSGGIFGMLEVVLSDFTRLEAETLAAEESAATAYDQFMDESNESVAVKEAEVEHKTGSKQLADEKNASSQKELALTQEELDKAMDVYHKLKSECKDTGLSYEDRKKAREEEIQSLKEALSILNQGDLA